MINTIRPLQSIFEETKYKSFSKTSVSREPGNRIPVIRHIMTEYEQIYANSINKMNAEDKPEHLPRRKEKESYFYSISMNSTLSNSCFSKTLESIKRVADNKNLHSVLKCSNYTLIWNRDTNASRNMYHISHEIWKGNPHPIQFKPTTINSTAIS
ncbi:hypothetical protein BD770DRAFT_406539 [Pilaira anomala]|nr:hypothetical protein BD770DRAFT_406539 [Pilaira anomala]